MSNPNLHILAAPDWKDYELLDSGDGVKLERLGSYTFVRPEHQALWSKRLSSDRWQQANAVFRAEAGEETGGRWQIARPLPEQWAVRYKALRFNAHFSSSRHLGVFPEQAAHWDWCAEKIRQAKRPVRVLNLFGYTGLASLAAAEAGAQVTHVDAAKKSLSWANENLSLSDLSDKPVRWILDDALKFVQREARRNSFYDGIILDPPKFGRGPKGEVWECFEMLPGLLQACRDILTPEPLFLVITAYAIRASALSLHYALEQHMKGLNGTIEIGELAVQERGAGRIISLAIYARWAGESLKGV